MACRGDGVTANRFRTGVGKGAGRHGDEIRLLQRGAESFDVGDGDRKGRMMHEFLGLDTGHWLPNSMHSPRASFVANVRPRSEIERRAGPTVLSAK